MLNGNMLKNKWFRALVRYGLVKLRAWLKSITPSDIKMLAEKINERVDAPKIDEKAEFAFIYRTLDNGLALAIAVLDVVEV